MQKRKELHIFRKIEKWFYRISETVVNSEWFYQRNYIKDIPFNSKINFVLEIDLFIEEYEKKGYKININ